LASKIGIIGIGAWATAIAKLLSENGIQIISWSQETELIKDIIKNHINRKYLDNVPLPKSILFTSDVEALNECEILVQAIPTQFIRNIFETYEFDLSTKYIVNLAKGIEKGTLKRVSEILNDFGISEDRYAILTGPSHAEEVARRVPTAVVVASKNESLSKLVQKLFSNTYFRVYTSGDVIGCELGGALKNVIAIAAGIVDGIASGDMTKVLNSNDNELFLGDNTKAALITRALAEITRLGVAMGAKPLTFSGLSGLGDLIVTCNSKFSRNRFVGEQLAKGKTLKEILNNMSAVAEGIDTTLSAYKLSQKYSVEMPITHKVYDILYNGLDPREALISLMLREAKPEWWW
jgi:glycerol-3-phosphate dehydrogenase (NAD(P)+)